MPTSEVQIDLKPSYWGLVIVNDIHYHVIYILNDKSQSCTCMEATCCINSANILFASVFSVKQ